MIFTSDSQLISEVVIRRNNMLKFLFLTMFAFILFAGCATTPAAVPATAMPTVPPAPTATTAPPTNTVAPTTAPTNTPAPTNTVAAANTPTAPAASPTRMPTLVVSRELLLGTWWQFDSQAQGNNHIIFKEDGTFKGRHGPSPQTGILVADGTFTLEQDELTITDKTDCPDGDTYRIKFTTKDHLFFKFLSSTCGSTAQDFTRQPNWDRLPDAP